MSTNLHKRDWNPLIFQCFLIPVFHAGDFNRRLVDWDYNDNIPDGECLDGWASINSLALLYNAKDATCFYAGRWNTGTNLDLAFTSVGPSSCFRIDIFMKICPGHDINLCLSHHQG